MSGLQQRRQPCGDAYPSPCCGEAPRPPAGFLAQLRLWTTKASVLALRRWRKTTLDFALLPLVGLLAGIANVEAQFVGPLPDELRGACISYFTWGAPAAQLSHSTWVEAQRR